MFALSPLGRGPHYALVLEWWFGYDCFRELKLPTMPGICHNTLSAASLGRNFNGSSFKFAHAFLPLENRRRFFGLSFSVLSTFHTLLTTMGSTSLKLLGSSPKRKRPTECCYHRRLFLKVNVSWIFPYNFRYCNSTSAVARYHGVSVASEEW